MLILVGGPSGVGKTTLAKRISDEFSLSVIHKDNIKESLYDTLGCNSLEQAKQLGRASWRIFYNFVKTQIACGNSLILESNFKSEFDSQQFRDIQGTYGVSILQVWCSADEDLIIQRFQNRAASDRHPGHNDALISEADLRDGIRAESSPLDIDGPIIQVSMNDFSSIDHGALFASIRKFKETGSEKGLYAVQRCR